VPYHVIGKWTKAAAALLAALAACATPEPQRPKGPRIVGRTAVSPAKAAPVKRAAAPEGSHYVAVEARVNVVMNGADLPLADEEVAKDAGMEARWKGAPEAVRERVRKSGVAVVPLGKKKIGEYYAQLRDENVPYVVTIDAIAQIAHMAIDRLLAEAEQKTLAPALGVVIARLDARLDVESKKTTSDLAPAYAAARGLVGVARALASGAVAPEDARRVVTHAGVQPSDGLGVMLDYALMAPRGALIEPERKGDLPSFRAMSWLAYAPLLLAAGAEVEGAPLDVMEARTHARAALLVAKILDEDAEASAAWEKIARAEGLVFGAPDDLTPRELVAIAQKAGLDAHDALAIQNVARIDRARHAWLQTRPPRIYDGVGAMTLPRASVRGALGMRIFGPAGTSDAEALQTLVSPSVPGRAMPAGVDVAAWLGSMEARVVPLAREGSRQAYDAALEALVKKRPPEDEWHASVHASGLAAIHTFLSPSLADGAVPATATSAWRRRKIEAALGAWTTLRHDGVPFTRLPARGEASAPAPAARGQGVLAFVEPHPEAIAQYVAMVEQAARGLAALGAIDTPPKDSVYAQADALLRTCLDVALHEANDEPQFGAELTDFPDRLAAIEQRLEPARGGQLPIAIDVHADLGKGEVLEEAIGGADDMYLVIREPVSGRLVLAAGAAIAQYEFTQPAPLLLTDEAWRARLAKSPPPRHAFASAYLELPK
jgi:hypothetical protein